MISIPVLDCENGSQVEALDFEESRLGGAIRKGLMRDAVLMYEANQHIGTASTKTRSVVSGSNRKPWKQKGTGRARAGHSRSPMWRGGAVVHGPQPRNRKYQINKKQKRLALRSALLAKCLDQEVLLVNSIECPEIKTRNIINLLDALKIEDTILIGLDRFDEVVWKSARNIPGVLVREIRNLNAYDVLVSKKLLFTKSAFGSLVQDFQAVGRQLKKEGVVKEAEPVSEDGKDVE